MRSFVFVDRDGTLVVEKGYLADPEEVELIEGAGTALCTLRAAGFGIAIVTNQSGVGRGYFGMDRVEAIHERIHHLLGAHGVSVDAVYVCPHLPEEGCACRKPGTAMIQAAVREHDADPCTSFIIGDKECDIVCGRDAGMASILVRTGYGASLEQEIGARANFVADDLLEAVDWILSVCRDVSNGTHDGQDSELSG